VAIGRQNWGEEQIRTPGHSKVFAARKQKATKVTFMKKFPGKPGWAFSLPGRVFAEAESSSRCSAGDGTEKFMGGLPHVPLFAKRQGEETESRGDPRVENGAEVGSGTAC